MIMGATKGAHELINQMCLQPRYNSQISLAGIMGGVLAANQPIPLVTDTLELTLVRIQSLLLLTT
jgi:hypothetical protein